MSGYPWGGIGNTSLKHDDLNSAFAIAYAEAQAAYVNALNALSYAESALNLVQQLQATIGTGTVAITGGSITGVTISQVNFIGSLLTMANLPTDQTTLPAGALWDNGGVLCIVSGSPGVVIPTDGYLRMNLPVDPSGLQLGALWNNGGLVCVVS